VPVHSSSNLDRFKNELLPQVNDNTTDLIILRQLEVDRRVVQSRLSPQLGKPCVSGSIDRLVALPSPPTMTKLHHSHHAFQPEKRRPNPVARTLPIPIERLDNAPIFQHIAHLTKRTPPSSSSSSGSSSSPSSTCAPNDNSARCQRPVSVANITTLTIVLGAVYVESHISMLNFC